MKDNYYRAWDCSLKKMSYCVTVYNNRMWWWEASHSHNIYDKSSKFSGDGHAGNKLMQCINRTDKNNRMIYESDKVLVHTSSINNEIIIIKNLIQMWNDGHDWIIKSPSFCLEVVGNIYEQ